MEAERFDRIVKRVSGAADRRRLLAGLLGAALAAAAPAAADTVCKPNSTRNRSKCNKDAQCCSRVCASGTCGCAAHPTSLTCATLRPPGGGLACHLLPTTEGCQVCTAEPSCENPDFPPCASTADCAAGSVCLGDPYCHVCVRICASA
jgi:hypothetical protein